MSLQSQETRDFVRLLTNHQSALRGFIISMMPGSPDIQDVLQDTNVVVWEKMESFEPGSNFRAWVFAIARNVMRAHFSKVRRDRLPTLDEQLTDLIVDTWYQREPKDLSAKEVALDQCLRSLDRSDREIIEARYSRHSSLEAYAEATDRPASTIRVLLFRIRDKLRRCVGRRMATEGRSS